ncbi:M48 family metallopeptidase [Ketobacter sp. MCCC 1A13808]|uniref:M48 family metallopeptidase n=1 Tax=Ketobacter sp. MCCC 1A13808 TaxID=2602738 RepID=UPI000F11C87C|nr:M48 family metallopeptidase [Ketobacter sp. MCCC 1A13808]MVF11673.1 M48 family metallopeptidase [Ketobacter sp. MCCC 1A13808]RLP55287.1 MAG: peptidase [Ketobacter sp.]
MKLSAKLVVLLLSLTLFSCASDGSFDAGKAVAVGAGVAQAVTLDENSVKQAASLAAKEMDSKTQVAADSSPYAQRLNKLVAGVQSYRGLQLDFKVYIAPDVNAFAMADGTVRVYSGLMDAMPDDQVLAVIGHEIGHVYNKHSYEQMQKRILTDSAFQAVVSVGGTVGDLTEGQLGQIAYTAVNAQFSQRDELESDTFAVRMLHDLGKDPYAMKRAIETLQAKFGSGGSFLSSHPSNAARVERIQSAINKL